MSLTRRAPLIAAVAGLALLAGCAPDHGTVTGRKVDVSCSTNRSYSCDPVWKLQITDTSARHPVYTDRPNYGWVKVSEEVYDQCRKGAAWPDCKQGLR